MFINRTATGKLTHVHMLEYWAAIKEWRFSADKERELFLDAAELQKCV